VAPRSGLYRNGGKRVFDLALVLVSLPITVPLILILALIVAAEGGRPFYSQPRLGRGGRTFRMWKLRTMVLDADARIEAYLASEPAARAEWDATQKLRNDPRVTRFGAFLRRSSLDELPQLLNVLRGEMSLVGPRPMMVEQRVLYPAEAYFTVRPGLTGYWQITDRNRTTFAARARYDSAYVADLSLWTDLRLIARTFAVVLRGTGC
jgi:lipopolysaccharide/colanic/teichoic acid biosynthesis glycosyltransferase